MWEVMLEVKKGVERCDTCQYVEENPTNLEDSIISKEIQGVGSTLDFLEIS